MPELRGLYAVTLESSRTDALIHDVAQTLAGGCRYVQYRDKSSDAAQRSERAQALNALCRTHGATLLINDDLELALTLDAVGVHLGQNDGDLAAARAALGPQRLLGASCYDDLVLAERAVACGADYIAFGAVYGSPTKPQARHAPLALLGQARRFGAPVCAIGGITLARAPEVIAAGADLLAVITDLFAAPDIAARAAAFQSLFEEDA